MKLQTGQQTSTIHTINTMHNILSKINPAKKLVHITTYTVINIFPQKS